MLGRKKDTSNHYQDSKVGSIRIKIRDNYNKNMVETQYKNLETEDENLSSFALNEIKTKMDLNNNFNPSFTKDFDDKTVCSSQVPDTRRFDCND